MAIKSSFGTPSEQQPERFEKGDALSGFILFEKKGKPIEKRKKSHETKPSGKSRSDVASEANKSDKS